LVRNKITGGKPAPKFAQTDAEVEHTIPALTSVLLNMFGERKFFNALKSLNAESQ
jgi:hypothetical protein